MLYWLKNRPQRLLLTPDASFHTCALLVPGKGQSTLRRQCPLGRSTPRRGGRGMSPQKGPFRRDPTATRNKHHHTATGSHSKHPVRERETPRRGKTSSALFLNEAWLGESAYFLTGWEDLGTVSDWHRIAAAVTTGFHEWLTPHVPLTAWSFFSPGSRTVPAASQRTHRETFSHSFAGTQVTGLPQ